MDVLESPYIRRPCGGTEGGGGCGSLTQATRPRNRGSEPSPPGKPITSSSPEEWAASAHQSLSSPGWAGWKATGLGRGWAVSWAPEREEAGRPNPRREQGRGELADRQEDMEGEEIADLGRDARGVSCGSLRGRGAWDLGGGLGRQGEVRRIEQASVRSSLQATARRQWQRDASGSAQVSNHHVVSQE